MGRRFITDRQTLYRNINLFLYFISTCAYVRVNECLCIRACVCECESLYFAAKFFLYNAYLPGSVG